MFLHMFLHNYGSKATENISQLLFEIKDFKLLN